MSFKIALLHAFRKSEWQSCISIKDNLLKSYKSLNYKIEEFDYDHLKGELHLERVSEEIKKFSPERIVFVDHRPTPIHIIEKLEQKNIECPIIIHCYGDFSVYASEWLDQDAWLRNKKVKLVAASPNQCDFINQFINDEQTYCETIPFPVDEEQFYIEENEALKFKNQFNIDDQVPLLFYAGRITKQKNVIELLECFNELKEIDPAFNAKLVIAGNCDDQGNPFLGEYSPEGLSSLKMNELIKKDIYWVGPLSKEQLLGAYNLCDAFISPSIFHDEDFGMAPAEASFCGQQLSLSRWGGYSNFLNIIGSEFEMKTIFEESRFVVKKSEITKALKNIKKVNTKTRNQIREKSLKVFEIKNIADKINELMKSANDIPKFSGFNKKMWFLANRFLKHQDSPFKDNENGQILSEYSELYNVYTN